MLHIVLKKLRNTEEVEDELEELKVCCHMIQPLPLCDSGCGCTGRIVSVTVKAKIRLVGHIERAVDEVSIVDQYWTALVTTTQWH